MIILTLYSLRRRPANLQFRTVTSNLQYREKLGSLLYYMIVMRPDLVYAVHMLARFAQRPTMRATAALTRALLYAYNTKWITLTLGGRNTIITGYSDSNLAACTVSRLSLSAYVVYVGCGPVEWGTKKQLYQQMQLL